MVGVANLRGVRKNVQGGGFNLFSINLSLQNLQADNVRIRHINLWVKDWYHTLSYPWYPWEKVHIWFCKHIRNIWNGMKIFEISVDVIRRVTKMKSVWRFTFLKANIFFKKIWETSNLILMYFLKIKIQVALFLYFFLVKIMK